MDYTDYESMFLGSRDIKIFYSVDKVESPKAAVVFVHGICEHLGRYEHIKNKFLDNGYNVYRYDARGHGRSEGKRGYLEDFTDYLEDLTNKQMALMAEIIQGKKSADSYLTEFTTMWSNGGGDVMLEEAKVQGETLETIYKEIGIK